MEFLYLFLMAFGAVLYLLIISKFLGKKQIAQLEFIDYVIGISLGSIAAEMATDLSDRPWYYYIIAMTVFVLFAMLITFLENKGPKLKNFLKGNPILIINEGEVNYKNLKKSKLDINDLITLCRIKGYFDLSNIKYAIFEINGQLSIMPNSENVPVVISDIGKEKQSEAPLYLVLDGVVSMPAIKDLSKDTSWLYKQLGIKSKKQLKNILLASYNIKSNKWYIQKK